MALTLAELGAIAVDNLATRYPYKTAYVIEGDADCVAPAQLTPAFASCFDWHSSVHNHWALVRLLREGVEVPGAAAMLAQNLATDRLAAECAHLSRPSRAGFEVPYGLSWLLSLAAELDAAKSEDVAGAARWRAAIVDLALAASGRLLAWLDRLPGPERSGQHSQSAFAMTLAIRAADALGGQLGTGALAAVALRRADEFYGGDRDAPVRFEPSAYDYVSPSLAEAELMSLVLPRGPFEAWLSGWLPTIEWEPAPIADRTDGKLAHLGGLNLSRAWMMRAIADALPPGGRADAYREIAEQHAAAGLTAFDGATYAGLHWIPTFAIAWQTGGLALTKRSPDR